MNMTYQQIKDEKIPPEEIWRFKNECNDAANWIYENIHPDWFAIKMVFALKDLLEKEKIKSEENNE